MKYFTCFLLLKFLISINLINWQVYKEYSDDYSDQDTVYTVAEEMPQFPGGPDELKSYIHRNLKYPVIGDVDIQGHIIIAFIIEKDGSITNAEIIRGFNDTFGFDENALNLIKEMPAWIPGKKNGIPVRVRYILPVYFLLNPNNEIQDKFLDKQN